MRNAMVRLPLLRYTGPTEPPVVDTSGRPVRLGVSYSYDGGHWEVVRLHRPRWGAHRGLLRIAPWGWAPYYMWVPMHYPRETLRLHQQTVGSTDGRQYTLTFPVI